MDYISIAWSSGLVAMDPTNFSLGPTQENTPASDDRSYFNFRTAESEKGVVANVWA